MRRLMTLAVVLCALPCLADDGQKHATSAREALGRAGAALKSR